MSSKQKSPYLPGHRRAAIALVGVREERAAQMLAQMTEAEVTRLTEQILALESVSGEEVDQALAHLALALQVTSTVPAPGVRFAEDILVRAFGEEQAAAVVAEASKPEPFEWLADADPDAVAAVLTSEAEPAVALALAHLSPTAAATILRRMPDTVRLSVAARIAGLASVSMQTIQVVDADLRRKVGDATAARVRKLSGAELLADILNASFKDQEIAVLSVLAETNPSLAGAVRDLLFTFEDLLTLDARSLQKVLASVENSDIATALANADEAAKETLLANVSERVREQLGEEMELAGNVRPVDIADARKRLVAAARTLEADGSIVIERGEAAA